MTTTYRVHFPVLFGGVSRVDHNTRLAAHAAADNLRASIRRNPLSYVFDALDAVRVEEIVDGEPTFAVRPSYKHTVRYIVCALVDGVVRTDQVLAASGRRARAEQLTRNYSVTTVVVVDTKFGTVLQPHMPTRR